MFSQTDYDKLLQIMEESPEKRDLLTRLLNSHQITLSTISHEIRNPLTLVYSTLQLIESRHPEVTSFAYWSDMHQDLEYMIQLLEDLSSYNNGYQLHPDQIDTVTYLKKIALSYASSLVDTDIEFRSGIAPDLPPTILDTVKFRQALLNLLNNAKDAVCAHSTSVRPVITLTADIIHTSDITNNTDGTSNSTELQIQIADNGCGISEEDLPTIFEPFITHKSNGTGLGLAVTNRVILAHHGSIQVHSTVDTGTTFTLRLPIHQNTQDKTG